LTGAVKIVGMFRTIDRARVAVALLMTVLFLGAVFAAATLSGFSSRTAPVSRPVAIASAPPTPHAPSWDEASSD
jgi:hypothetical protein